MSDWISVKERLPDADFMVIVCSDDDVFIDVMRSGYVEGDFWFDCERDKGLNVTHWMAMPKSPAESKVSELKNHDVIDIKGIGNYYGCLSVKVEGGVPYWSIENWDGHGWEEIPESLYLELIEYNESP